jgi:hypothetical protein
MVRLRGRVRVAVEAEVAAVEAGVVVEAVSVRM